MKNTGRQLKGRHSVPPDEKASTLNSKQKLIIFADGSNHKNFY